jgi:hypothetical protein
MCSACGTEFVGRRCGNCGVLPEQHRVKPPALQDILDSDKFQRRLMAEAIGVARPGTMRFKRDDVPWKQWSERDRDRQREE